MMSCDFLSLLFVQEINIKMLQQQKKHKVLNRFKIRYVDIIAFILILEISGLKNH